MKRSIIFLSLFALSCSSGGGSDSPNNTNNNPPACTTNCTTTGEDLLTASFGTTNFTKEKDLAADENGGQFGPGCKADKDGNAVADLQIHPNLSVGKKFNVINKQVLEGNPLQGYAQSDEITGINAVSVEINHRIHELQVKGIDPQAQDNDIVCKFLNAKETCAKV